MKRLKQIYRKILKGSDSEWLRGKLVGEAKIVRKRRLKVKHDWKMLLFVIILSIIGCLIGAYIGFNYPY